MNQYSLWIREGKREVKIGTYADTDELYKAKYAVEAVKANVNADLVVRIDKDEDFERWYDEVVKLVDRHELVEFYEPPDPPLPQQALYSMYQKGMVPEDAAHVIGHDGI